MKAMLGFAISMAVALGACKVEESAVDGGVDGGEMEESDASGEPPDAAQDEDPDAAPSADAEPEAQGPLVEVLAPDEPDAGDFSTGAIVTEETLSVRCEATQNPDTGEAVDTSSVGVVVTGGGGEVVEASAQPALAANEYETDISLAEFANGELTVACEASDSAPSPATSSAEITTYLDLGPRIEIVNPVEGAAYANRIDVFVLVEAAPVAMGDEGADPDLQGAELFVSGEPIGDLTLDEEEGVLEASVAFDDFDPELIGDNTLTVRASNSRQAEPVTREEIVEFNADGAGPTIAVESPEPGTLVSGIFTVTATVTDSAGVDSSSVVATIAGEHEFVLDPVAEDTYVGSFDTRELDLGLVYPSVVVRARDSVGNEGQFGFLVALDNRSPLLSLDPPDVREAQRNEEGDLLCSRLFDPLGGDAAEDGQSVPQLSEIRTRIEDLGNGALSTPGVFVRRAGVDQDEVQLFVLDDETGALLVDTTGNGDCDSINPLLEPTSVPETEDEAAVLNLVPLGPEGNSEFAQPLEPYEETGPESECTAPEAADDPQAALCSQSPGTRQMATTFGGEPAVFSIAPATDDQCWGFAFDAPAANISDGFACLATRAEDNLGNVAVSPPLRLCFDSDGEGDEGCAPIGDLNPEPLPDCTGVYDAETDTVDATASCDALGFTNDDGFQLRRIDLD